MNAMQAWVLVIAALESETTTANADDHGMQTAAADDLFAWCDDLEDRYGFSVPNMRAAVLNYVLLRDGSDDPDIQEYLRAL